MNILVLDGIELVSMYKAYIREKIRYIIRSKNKHIGAVLMLHRVDMPDREGIWLNQHLKMSPDSLIEMIEYAQKHKCRFVSLDELCEAISRGKNARRLIALTFDDGYRDNYTNAYPILKKYNIPFTIFVSTDVINGKILYWWDVLEKIIRSNDVLKVFDKNYKCFTVEEKEKAFFELRKEILLAKQDDIEDKLRAMFSEYPIDLYEENDKMGLTWDMVKEMSESGLCTIGNHTFSHKSFSGCSDEDILKDIKKAQDAMSEKAHIDMKYFAYPYGDNEAVTQHDIDVVKSIGFRGVVTSKHGYISYSSDVNNLERIFISDDEWKDVLKRIAYC